MATSTRVVAFCVDNGLFLKLVPNTAALLAGLPQQELFPCIKPYALADERLDDSERLHDLQRARPAPKPKRPKAKKAAKR
jgi:hypothetical protein